MTNPGSSRPKPPKKPREYKPPAVEGRFLVGRHGALYGNDPASGIYPADWERVKQTRKKLSPLKPDSVDVYKLVRVDNKGNEVPCE